MCPELDFRDHYNEQRPHRALQRTTPGLAQPRQRARPMSGLLTSGTHVPTHHTTERGGIGTLEPLARPTVFETAPLATRVATNARPDPSEPSGPGSGAHDEHHDRRSPRCVVIVSS